MLHAGGIASWGTLVFWIAACLAQCRRRFPPHGPHNIAGLAFRTAHRSPAYPAPARVRRVRFRPCGLLVAVALDEEGGGMSRRLPGMRRPVSLDRIRQLTSSGPAPS